MVDKIMKRAGLFAAIQRKQQKILGFPAVLYLPFYIAAKEILSLGISTVFPAR